MYLGNTNLYKMHNNPTIAQPVKRSSRVLRRKEIVNIDRSVPFLEILKIRVLENNNCMAALKKPLNTFQFVKDNKGSITTRMIETGAFKVSFSSDATGRTAFAYGKSFEKAYQNLIRNFNQKYLAA